MAIQGAFLAVQLPEDIHFPVLRYVELHATVGIPNDPCPMA
jgi:hypothetical protein